MMDTGDFRPSGKHLTDIEIAKILGCNKGGATQREIAVVKKPFNICSQLTTSICFKDATSGGTTSTKQPYVRIDI
jgi:hypothetical protein